MSEKQPAKDSKKLTSLNGLLVPKAQLPPCDVGSDAQPLRGQVPGQTKISTTENEIPALRAGAIIPKVQLAPVVSTEPAPQPAPITSPAEPPRTDGLIIPVNPPPPPPPSETDK
jgi:hypothetical protein